MANRFVFTIQKPTLSDRPERWPDVSMVVYQLEGPNPHYQGYVEFRLPKTFAEMKAIHGKMYFFPARGSAEVNVRYCTKERSRMNPDEYFYSSHASSSELAPRLGFSN